MLLPLLQVILLGALLLYLAKWRGSMRRRNIKSWDQLFCQLRTDWSAHAVCDRLLWQEDVNASHDDIWEKVNGPYGLWVMHQNARVLLEMADFAAKHASPENPVDPLLLESIRTDAMQIRLCVLMAIAQYAVNSAKAGARVNARRAAETYVLMAARLTRIMQEHAALQLPDFIAAM
jgi:hypothetical protein